VSCITATGSKAQQRAPMHTVLWSTALSFTPTDETRRRDKNRKINGGHFRILGGNDKG